MRVLALLGVLVAGGAGAVARHLVHLAADRRGWPALRGTLLVNVAGSGLLGALVGMTASGLLPAPVLAIAGSGFCGAFTTFSGFTVHTVELAGGNRRAARRAAGRMVLLCALAAAVGALLAGVR